MFSRRSFVLGLFAGATLTAVPAAAHHTKKKPFKLDPRFKPQVVRFSGYPTGTLVVDPRNHYLYLVLSRGRARRYGVALAELG